MRKRYVKENFWTMATDSNASVTWKAILRISDTLAKNIEREISIGMDTDLWRDPWIDHKSLIDHLGWDTCSAYGCPSTKVHNILENDHWRSDRIPCSAELKRKIDFFFPLYFGREHDKWK